jgi:hypothetical protein
MHFIFIMGWLAFELTAEANKLTFYIAAGLSDTSSTDWPQTGLVAMAKGSSTGNLGTVITKLPDAFIIEILSRLPPKSLCHCKCISRELHCLISHPDNLKKFTQTLALASFSTPKT